MTDTAVVSTCFVLVLMFGDLGPLRLVTMEGHKFNIGTRRVRQLALGCESN